MISFMVLGGPRSATTWAANWWRLDTTMAFDDPFLEYPLEQLHRLMIPDQRLGISCTSTLLYPDWVNAQKCPKVILFREPTDINRSLRELGLVELIPMRHFARIVAINDAMVIPYEKLFEPKTALIIARHLGVPFDAGRHNLLRQMRVEPLW